MRIIGLFLLLTMLSCFPSRGARSNPTGDYAAPQDNSNDFTPRLFNTLRNAELPEDIILGILAASEPDSTFFADLFACLEDSQDLRFLVDKQHPLPADFAPTDLVTLEDGFFRVTRAGMTLRRPAVDSLNEMAAAARAEGINLTVASAYRSFAYQTEVNTRLVRQMGQEAADRVSARPGHSQHQTGLVVDFAQIDNAFNQSPAGRWVAANASRFGWSLSYPQGYEAITGYSWESWHYRYVGRELAAFIDNYFGGIQQYALRFLHEWELL